MATDGVQFADLVFAVRGGKVSLAVIGVLVEKEGSDESDGSAEIGDDAPDNLREDLVIAKGPDPFDEVEEDVGLCLLEG